MINLIQSDVGRPVGHIVSNLTNYDQLTEDARSVLQRLVPLEQEVQTQRGDWYLMRISPYRTLDNVIEGAVMTFMDISARKRLEQALDEALAFSEGIVDTLRESLLVLDVDLRVLSANRAFQRTFLSNPADIKGQPLWELDSGQWDIPALHDLLLDIQSKGSHFDDFRVSHDFARIGPRDMLLNARRLDSAGGGPAPSCSSSRMSPSGGRADGARTTAQAETFQPSEDRDEA